VKDSAGQQLAYIYFEDEPGRIIAARRARATIASGSSESV
jgi:hypothetical protein